MRMQPGSNYMLPCPNKPVLLFIQHHKQAQVKFLMRSCISCTGIRKPHMQCHDKMSSLTWHIACICFEMGKKKKNTFSGAAVWRQYQSTQKRFLTWLPIISLSSCLTHALSPPSSLLWHYRSYHFHLTSSLVKMDHSVRVVTIREVHSSVFWPLLEFRC